MKLLSAILLLFIVSNLYSQKTEKISIIPEPVSMQTGSGYFYFGSDTKVIVDHSNGELNKLAENLSGKLRNISDPIIKSNKFKKQVFPIRLQLISNEKLGNEGYILKANNNELVIEANKPAGIFYGIQTLYQLMPKEIEGKNAVATINWRIPAITITDYPRFEWRGLMFDVSRHFFTKQDVKDFIDEMVKYKFNLLHMHLTDDQGWRIEIKSLPLLTKVGAWRVKHEGKWANVTAPDSTAPKTYGGFYTQDDIRELVKYASDRYVNILPEVDVPGHSMAAVASYPDLSCTPGSYQVNAGEEFMIWGGKTLQESKDNTLCPANEKVYVFLDKVFTEIAQLFPFPYIHMGGDECAKNFWEQSQAVKDLMQKEGLKNLEEVQSYFVKRVEKIVESKGKKLIGWDEIIEGGLAPNAAVMSWRGIKGGIEAAKANHHVVMSPTTFAYLDYMQGDSLVEPPVYATLLLNKAYGYEPVPDGIDKKYILGGQGNLWTEQLSNMRAVEYMTWPRALALAEVFWSQAERKNWPSFVSRVEDHFQRMDVENVRYATSMYDVNFSPSMDKDQIKLILTCQVPGVDIFYSYDESIPDQFYPKYSGVPLTIPKDAVHVKVVTYRNGKQIGKQMNMPVSELIKRIQNKE